MRRFILLVSISVLPVTLIAQNWSPKDYSKHDPVSFLKIEALYQFIDFNNIDRPLLHAAMFFVTNEERVRHKLPPFKHMDKMEKIAAEHADDMVNYNFYSHVSRVKGKRTVADRFKREGLTLMTIAENISSSHGLQYEAGRKVNAPGRTGIFTYASSKREVLQPHTYISYAREAVRLWMGSPSHRKSILNPYYEYLGCGASVYGEKTFYNMPYFMGVQCFGSAR